MCFATHLTNLQKLDLSVKSTCTLPAGLSTLGKILELDLYLEGYKPIMRVIDGQQLCSLRAVTLEGSSVAYDHLLCLANAPSSFSARFNLLPADERSAQYYAALAGMFGKYAPEVQVKIEGLESCDIWSRPGNNKSFEQP